MESRNFNVTHRLLHWSIALCIVVLVFTALVHISWLNKTTITQILNENLHLYGDRVSEADAAIIAKRIVEPMWNWHFYMGYALIALYFLRMVHFMVYGIQFPNPLDKSNTLKQRAQGAVYILFYVLLGITTVSGILMLWGPTQFRYTSQIIHYQSHYYAIAFVFIHFAGIVFTELTMERGVASKMIHG